MSKIASKFRQGVVSFYVVAFSTLILVVIATSFAVIIISEITRTANDELSQSAYDAAMAGVEEAKLAYASYYNCLTSGSTKPAGCDKIIEFYDENKGDCYLVKNILYNKDGDYEKSGEVEVGEEEAYTCVTFDAGTLQNYQAGVGGGEVKTVKVKTEKKASEINSVKISWGKDTGGRDYYGGTFNQGGFKYPVLAVTLIQTGTTFNLSDFDKTDAANQRTNRATVYLVPISGNSSNKISASDLVKTNDRTSENTPKNVKCDESEDNYPCSVVLELPGVIGGGDRSDDTFMFAISAPYGEDNVEFKMDFCTTSEDCDTTESSNIAGISGMQISIDSTGRANNLYRRVEARIDIGEQSSSLPIYALELLGGTGTNPSSAASLLEKNLTVTVENSNDYEEALGVPGNLGNGKYD